MTLENSIFDKHYQYYKSIGIETIKQQAGQVEQVSSDYQGRVIYELLQNAFDKADKNICVQVKGNSLYVANDGEKFTYVAGYDYERGTSKRGDFQSLCSISTSTKNASTSIGNKGVGFKSVFSISEFGFVNVYTQGLMLQGETSIAEPISFRIYDSFKNRNKIPFEFDKDLQDNINEKIALVQHERGDRGIPGYYFPFHILEEPIYIQELFDKKFVTVIEIPFKDKESIQLLFDEIKKIHFQFIRLKKDKNFVINFDFDDEINIKEVSKDNPYLFSAAINSPKLKDIAINAGILNEQNINSFKPKVAFYLREKNKENEQEDGLIYNYLPTKVKSPFKNVDFHADFHTTVDRKSINFEGEIGKYNKALLKACIELFFVTVNNYLSLEDRVQLNVEFVDKNEINFDFHNFEWSLFEINRDLDVFELVTNTLRISEWEYTLISDLFSRIAKKYFDIYNNDIERYNIYYQNLLGFIRTFTNDYNKQYSRSEAFKKKLGEKILSANVQILPNIKIQKNTEILFRKSSDSLLQLPNFLGVNVTDFEIPDTTFRNALNIKEFNDYNEILKYFKQCSFNGDYNNVLRLNEEQQKEIVQSIFRIYEAKNVEQYLSTHRFTKSFNSKLRESNSTLNQANFNISTIFIRTNSKKYKPAQLCTIYDVDVEFFDGLIPESQRNDFLRFLGVSTESKYMFADSRIYRNLKEGLNYIPALVDRREEKITEDLIINFHIITPSGKLIHPATVNDNNYRFLDSVNYQPIKAELDNILTKRYEVFPTPFRERLKKRINKNVSYTNDIIRLYQSVFYLFEKDKQFLISEDGQLSWTSSTDFIIINSKSDFDLLKMYHSKKILCYYSGGNLPGYLNDKIINPKKGKINFTAENQNDSLKNDIENKMIYLLVSISQSKSSDKNYLEDNIELTEIQKRLEQLVIKEVDGLEQEIVFKEISIMSSKVYAIEEGKAGTIYFNKNATFVQKAEGIAEYLFGNTTIKELVELILFYKEVDDLFESVDKTDYEIINKKWKKDYVEKYKKFEAEILLHFQSASYIEDDKWFMYSSTHKSELLVTLDKQNALNKLDYLIETLKQKPEYIGYFDNFKLEINRNSVEKFAAKLISFLQLNNLNGNKELISKIKELSLKLGVEKELENIEIEITTNFPNYIQHDSEKQNSIAKEISTERKINNIFEKIGKSKEKQLNNIEFHGDISLSKIPISPRKLIFQQGELLENISRDFEATGATGEEEVLIYYIEEFIKLPIEKRVGALNQVYGVIKNKTGNDSLKKYMDKCVEVFGNNSDLRKALIPLFYVTMHYKYSYFDLIVYKDNQPVLVEVKTTNHENYNSFYLSISEVNAARSNENYEIVRVSPQSINLLGNPIKLIEDKIATINGTNFSLLPRNYEFKFK